MMNRKMNETKTQLLARAKKAQAVLNKISDDARKGKNYGLIDFYQGNNGLSH